ncbi:MAG: M20/M25/M40 family metallo-hydrolase [Bdellovibrionales bacterium]|nr:M20/M25/M40 family metallo-hydrolase [Bdellovibrionales bacterium]
MNVIELARQEMHVLGPLYKELHCKPETAFRELETAARLTQELRAVGFTVTTGIGKTGIIGVLENGPGPVLLIRTDMDALPIKEQTGVSYQSLETYTDEDGEVRPVMHACGHDIHMASFVGAARLLAGPLLYRWSGTLLMLGQPAEEILSGAKAMLRDLAFDAQTRPTKVAHIPKPDAAVAMHIGPAGYVGTVGYRIGKDSWRVSFYEVIAEGAEGHAGNSTTFIDPSIVLLKIVAGLDSADVMKINPAKIHFKKLTKRGEKAVALLGLKSLTDEQLSDLLQEIERCAAQTEQYYEGRVSVVLKPRTDIGADVLVNDAQLAGEVVEAFKFAFKDQVVLNQETGTPKGASEDFANFGSELGIPIFRWGLGVRHPDDTDGSAPPRVHTSTILPDYEGAVPIGASSFAVAAITILSKKRK